MCWLTIKRILKSYNFLYNLKYRFWKKKTLNISTNVWFVYYFFRNSLFYFSMFSTSYKNISWGYTHTTLIEYCYSNWLSCFWKISKQIKHITVFSFKNLYFKLIIILDIYIYLVLFKSLITTTYLTL